MRNLQIHLDCVPVPHCRRGPWHLWEDLACWWALQWGETAVHVWLLTDGHMRYADLLRHWFRDGTQLRKEEFIIIISLFRLAWEFGERVTKFKKKRKNTQDKRTDREAMSPPCQFIPSAVYIKCLRRCSAWWWRWRWKRKQEVKQVFSFQFKNVEKICEDIGMVLYSIMDPLVTRGKYCDVRSYLTTFIYIFVTEFRSGTKNFIYLIRKSLTFQPP